MDKLLHDFKLHLCILMTSIRLEPANKSGALAEGSPGDSCNRPFKFIEVCHAAVAILWTIRHT